MTGKSTRWTPRAHKRCKQNVTLHLKSIYEEGELDELATCKDYLQVRSEGGREVSRKLRHYNLAAILAIGYRVRSHRGTQFRQWATARLSEYLVKGFAMDDERLKNQPENYYFFAAAFGGAALLNSSAESFSIFAFARITQPPFVSASFW